MKETQPWKHPSSGLGPRERPCASAPPASPSSAGGSTVAFRTVRQNYLLPKWSAGLKRKHVQEQISRNPKGDWANSLGKWDSTACTYVEMPAAAGEPISPWFWRQRGGFCCCQQMLRSKPCVNFLPPLTVGKSGIPWAEGGSPTYRECAWFATDLVCLCWSLMCFHKCTCWEVSWDHPINQGSFWGMQPPLTPRQGYCFSGTSLITFHSACSPQGFMSKNLILPPLQK